MALIFILVKKEKVDVDYCPDYFQESVRFEMRRREIK